MYEGIEGALKVALIDFIMVFIILGLLALSMIGLHEIIKLTSRKKAGESKITLAEKDRIISEPQDREEIITEKKSEDGQLVAVISAALSGLMERPKHQIKIINIRRIMPAGANPWTIAGKQSIMSKRISMNSRKRGGF